MAEIQQGLPQFHEIRILQGERIVAVHIDTGQCRSCGEAACAFLKPWRQFRETWSWYVPTSPTRIGACLPSTPTWTGARTAEETSQAFVNVGDLCAPSICLWKMLAHVSCLHKKMLRKISAWLKTNLSSWLTFFEVTKVTCLK